jgi:mono/diheme cytochrome c family protein
LLTLVAALSASFAQADDAVDYDRDVRPILGKRCVGCHGPATKKSGLRVDAREFMLQGGDRGPAIVPGAVEKSPLIQAIGGGGGDVPTMPPRGTRLTDAEVAVIRSWVAHGAAGPAASARDGSASAASEHWAFRPITRPQLPAARHANAVRNPIDQFILARLDREGIEPAPEADRRTLLRRLSLDLIGLPPTTAEIDAFLADPQADAYDRCVERLLASPHYGERWARYWLDDAAYADSGGYESDFPRTLWPYRDWVIDAHNRDMPFDQFVIEQLAGDLLPSATVSQRVATGFLCTAMFDGTLGQYETARLKMTVDRVNLVGTVYLGLTLGCAQCHSHKFDPISQREYYQFFAFLNELDDTDNDAGVALELGTPEQFRARDTIRACVAQLERDLKAYEQSAEPQRVAWETRLDPAARTRLAPDVRAALAIAPAKRDDAQKATVSNAYFVQDAERLRRVEAIKRKRDEEPKLVAARVAKDVAKPRGTRVFRRGEFSQPAEAVMPGVPAVLPPISSGGRGDRLALARWLVGPGNPLTARVIVNRVWQRHFGVGLVETEDNFGLSGEPPSHPELLDWLATALIARGWSMKALHRLIVGSATYRQSSRTRSELAERDPANRLLARQSRLRLEAEALRDSALAVSGLLSSKLGGPSVFPYQPDGIMAGRATKADWVVSPGADRHRRTLYTCFWRTTPHPFLRLFDAPDTTSACTRRIRSNTPLQALTLLNDPEFTSCANALAQRLRREVPAAGRDRIRHAYRLCLAREPLPRELEKIERFLDEARTDDGWAELARALLNLDEFVTKE